MRVIGGVWRGREIASPKGADVRPTGDRVREAWFSIVQFDVPGARVLDLCAGTGALGIEALSRGALHVTFVDTSAPVLAALQKSLDRLGASATQYTLCRGDAVEYVRKQEAHAADLAFADPPYALNVAQELASAWQAIPFARVLGIEHAAARGLGGSDERRYGQTAITFFRV
jgi:16S rRNA (guanine966-N2)-methyltransferase